MFMSRQSICFCWCHVTVTSAIDLKTELVMHGYTTQIKFLL